METMIQSALISGEQSIGILLIIFATGLLTSLTPCVYPMLPITVSVVGKQSKSRKHAFGLSILYVLGLALVYAALGVLAASTGKLFGSVASHPITLFIIASFCLVMALWILGWMVMPSLSFLSTSNQLTHTKNKYLSVFLAGCLSGTVMAPCTSPVLGMLLMYVAGEGDLIWAGLLMFIFAFGMSALLVVAGIFSGLLTLLPKSGRWLGIVKWVMAIPMIAAAIYFMNQAIF